MAYQIKKRYLFPILLLGAFTAGPRMHFDPVQSQLPTLDLEIEEVEAYVAHEEAKVLRLKAENGSRIIWADSTRQTDYAIVYLHGFSASPVEGAPIHQELAKRYGYNLYLPRLAGHGIDDKESFVDLTPEKLMASAREAIAIGQILGKKVLLMSCSTGGTLSTYLAAHNPEAIDALMMYSPNFALSSKASLLLTKPWGLQIARQVTGSNYRKVQLPQTCHPYWTIDYRLEGVVCLQDLLEQTMTEEVYQMVRQPTFLAYYYKNEEEQDQVISIEEIKNFAENCAVAEDQKRVIPFSEVGAHVMVSNLQSKDLESVRRESFRFVEEVLGWSAL